MDQIQPQAGGEMMPQMPMQPGQMPQNDNQPVSDEKRQELLNMIQQIQLKLGSFNALNFASSNKTEKVRRDILRQVFEKLQLAGVDLTNKQSVADFIAKLRQDNPELADMFEKAMDTLLGGGGMASAPQDPTAAMDLGITPQNNNMNINQNEALSKNI